MTLLGLLPEEGGHREAYKKWSIEAARDLEMANAVEETEGRMAKALSAFGRRLAGFVMGKREFEEKELAEEEERNTKGSDTDDSVD